MKGIRRRFFVRYLAYILVPVFIPVVILGTLIITMISQTVKNDLRVSSVEHANLIAAALSNQVVQDVQHKRLMYSNTDSNNAYTVLKAILRQNSVSFETYQQYKIIRNNILADLAVKPEILYTVFYAGNPYNSYYDQGVRYLSGDEQWFHLGMSLESGDMLYSRYTAPSGVPALLAMYKIDPHSFWAVWYDYDTLLQAMTIANLPEQSCFYVMDNNGTLLFSQGDETEAADAFQAAQDTETITLSGRSYIAAQAETSSFQVLMLSPLSGLENLHSEMIPVFLTSMLASLLVCIGLALLFALREYRQIRTVLNLLDHPEAKPVSRPKRLRDEYSHILDGTVAQYVHSVQLQMELTERKHQLELAQLGALQYQINPHFIVNTLQIVDFELLRQNGKQGPSNELIASLAALLDYSLHSPIELAPMREEIRVTEEYLHILQLRYDERFRSIWDYDSDVLEYGTPKLLLQPLIENCVLHGLHDRTSTNPGMLVIQLRCRNNQMMVRILDNGVGIPREKLIQLRNEINHLSWTKRHNIGLRNIYQRLTLFFGKDCTFRIYSIPGQGTLFRVQFPLVQPGVSSSVALNSCIAP